MYIYIIIEVVVVGLVGVVGVDLILLRCLVWCVCVFVGGGLLECCGCLILDVCVCVCVYVYVLADDSLLRNNARRQQLTPTKRGGEVASSRQAGRA